MELFSHPDFPVATTIFAIMSIGISVLAGVVKSLYRRTVNMQAEKDIIQEQRIDDKDDQLSRNLAFTQELAHQLSRLADEQLRFTRKPPDHPTQ